MATTAEEIVEQARDYHPGFNRQKIPDIGALKTLERLQRQLAELVLMEHPDALSVWHTIEGLPEDWEDGLTLPENLGVLGVEAEYFDETNRTIWEVAILSPNQQLTHPHMTPSVYTMGGKLYLSDIRRWYGEVHGWEDLTRIRVRINPVIGTLPGLGTLITLPDTAVAALVPSLALWMADRVGVSLPNLRASAEASVSGWVNHMIMTGANRAWFVEVVR